MSWITSSYGPGSANNYTPEQLLILAMHNRTHELPPADDWQVQILARRGHIVSDDAGWWKVTDDGLAAAQAAARF